MQPHWGARPSLAYHDPGLHLWTCSPPSICYRAICHSHAAAGWFHALLRHRVLPLASALVPLLVALCSKALLTCVTSLVACSGGLLWWPALVHVSQPVVQHGFPYSETRSHTDVFHFCFALHVCDGMLDHIPRDEYAEAL